nr:MAG TPA: hypothetical protein [Caudoviricetes sp.]
MEIRFKWSPIYSDINTKNSENAQQAVCRFSMLTVETRTVNTVPSYHFIGEPM